MHNRFSLLRLSSLVVVASIAACGGSGDITTPPPPPPPPASPQAVTYLTAALDIMQTNSLNKYKVDWPTLRATALDGISGAQTTRDTYPALVTALHALGDHHSFLLTPEGTPWQSLRSAWGTVSARVSRSAVSASWRQLLSSGLGYITVHGNNPLATTPEAIANELQQFVSVVDQEGSPCGWIIDLRDNTGGDMWPMIAGLGAIMGDGDLGAFVTADSVRSTWFLRHDSAGVRYASGYESVAASVTDPLYTLTRGVLPPVAVIHGPVTASSGEALAIAFRGRPDTRSFGQSTAGLSTANAQYVLSDGAQLVLTVAVDVDRAGNIYGGQIGPDQPISWGVIDPTDPADTAAAAASRWLLAQPACT